MTDTPNLARAQTDQKMPYAADLEQKLDGWGRVVAHRAGILARARFRPAPADRFGLEPGHTSLMPTAVQLAQVFGWRWTTQSADLPDVVSESRGPRRGSPSNPREVLISYTEIVRLLPSSLVPPYDRIHQPTPELIAGPLVEQLACWLYACPHYTGPRSTSIESFVIAKIRRRSGPVFDGYLGRLGEEWREWYRNAAATIAQKPVASTVES